MSQEITYKWVQARLPEWHSGAISAQDREQLEDIARRDPFVADALEGYASHPDVAHDAYLEELAKRIAPRRLPRRRWIVPNLTITAIAACAILIAGYFAVIHRINDDPKASKTSGETSYTLQLDTNAADVIASALPDTTPDIAVASEGTSSTAAIPSPGSTTSRSVISAPPASSDVREEKEEKKSDDDTSVAGGTLAQPAETLPVEVSILPAESAPAGKILSDRMEDYSNALPRQVLQSHVTGKVVDVQDIGIPAAMVMIENTSLHVMTGADGSFEMYLPGITADLIVFAEGYADFRYTIHQSETDVWMTLEKQHPASSPAGNAAAKESDASRDIKKSFATPAYVKDQAISPGQRLATFHRFALNNTTVRLANDMTQNPVAVQVHFTIDSTRHPKNITVADSAIPERYRKAAVALIEKSPEWSCASDTYPCDGHFTFYFLQ